MVVVSAFAAREAIHSAPRADGGFKKIFPESGFPDRLDLIRGQVAEEDIYSSVSAAAETDSVWCTKGLTNTATHR